VTLLERVRKAPAMCRHWLPFTAAVLAAGCALPNATPPTGAFPAPEPRRELGATQIPAASLKTFPAVPLLVTIDVSRVERTHPGIERWATHAALLCRAWYPVLCAELPSEGFKPRTEIALVFVPEERVPAAYADGMIIINVAHLSSDPSNYGMVIHELVHAVQEYPPGPDLSWLREGIADYVRFYLYEVDPAAGWIRPGRSRHTDSYRTTACFLDYLVRTYDREIVRKLHAALRRRDVTEDEIQEIFRASSAARGAPRREVDALFAEFMADWVARR